MRPSPLVALSFGVVACAAPGGGERVNTDPTVDARSFSLGFTTWPYDATVDAALDTEERVATHGDLYGVWVDNGVPWDAALAGGPYPAAVEAELDGQAGSLPDDHEILVSLGLLDSSRVALATDWDGVPRTGSWETAAFDDPDVQAAYAQWALDVVDRLDPDWLNIALEASDVAASTPEQWPALESTICATYDAVKAAHPDLPVFFSVALKGPESEESDRLRAHLPGAVDCTDLAAVSTYGYLFYGHADPGDPDQLPDDWLKQAREMLPGKQLAIGETAWIAERLRVDEWDLDIPADELDQAAYVTRMMEAAAAEDVAFIAWFSVVDYDALWAGALAEDPVGALWRDTGLYDSDLASRPALDVWEAWRALPRE